MDLVCVCTFPHQVVTHQDGRPGTSQLPLGRQSERMMSSLGHPKPRVKIHRTDNGLFEFDIIRTRNIVTRLHFMLSKF
jgi:hypothetical protein